METNELNKNPIEQFNLWLQEATDAKEKDPNAFTLATVTKDNRPSARVLLYKGIRDNKFMFYTNYTSRKAQELFLNPQASILFYWPTIYKQIRIEGTVSKMERQQSQQYFQTRSRESQLGAWASHQSHAIASRESIQKQFTFYEEQFKDQEIPCPEHWGGFYLEPHSIEFWLGRPHRLHDRFIYSRHGDDWEITRLAP